MNYNLKNNLLFENCSLFIKEILIKYEYFPETKNFSDSEKNKTVPDEINFKKIFPKYFEFSLKIDEMISNYLKTLKDFKDSNLNSKIKTFTPKIITENESEINEFIIKNYWEKLKIYTKQHITIFLYMVNINFEKNNIFNDYDKNIIFWAILFHDCGKHIIMNKIEEKSNFNSESYVKDLCHPFKSFIIFIESFLDKNKIIFENLDEKNKFIDDFNNLKEILLDSFEVYQIVKDKILNDKNKNNKNISNDEKIKDENKKTNSEKNNEIDNKNNKENNKENNNEKSNENNNENNNEYIITDIRYNLTFKHIKTIETFLLNLKKQNKFIYDISVLILFHQSLPNNDDFMNRPLLPENYIKNLFDLRLIELMRIIMIYDSCSHSLFMGGNWIKQINKHINLLRNLFN